MCMYSACYVCMQCTMQCRNMYSMQCTYVHMPAHQAGCPCKMYKGLLSSEGGGAPVVLHYQMSRLASLPTDHRP